MDDEQPIFKVVDRRPFNPDGSPRELSPEEKTEQPAPEPVQAAAPEPKPAESTPPPQPSKPPQTAKAERPPPAARSHEPEEHLHTGDDPLDNPASFLSLIMSLASNAAASLGMMAHPLTGESGVDLKTAKHWIDVVGMLEQKTRGNLDPQEAQVMESLLADLRMQYVSLTSSPQAGKFSASDITGGQ